MWICTTSDGIFPFVFAAKIFELIFLMRIKTSGWHFVALASPPPSSPLMTISLHGENICPGCNRQGSWFNNWSNFSFKHHSMLKTLKTNSPQIVIYVNFVGERKTSWMGVGWKGEGRAKRGHCPSISKDRFEAASKHEGRNWGQNLVGDPFKNILISPLHLHLCQHFHLTNVKTGMGVQVS